MNHKLSVRQLTACAILAALYAALTIVTAPLSYGLVQFRLSEALIVLCWFQPYLGVGITLGCLIANLFSTVTALDIIIGTLATALACLWTGRCRSCWLSLLPNIVVNAVLVGGMLAFVLFPEQKLLGFVIAAAQVGFGELAVMTALGIPLMLFARRTDFIARVSR